MEACTAVAPGHMENASDTERPREQEDTTLQPTSPFLRLPGELRNRIYALAIEDHIASIGKKRCRDRQQWKKPSILRTCSQFRREGLSIWHHDYVIIRWCTSSTKPWNTLLPTTALRITLTPSKYNFNSMMTDADALREAQSSLSHDSGWCNHYPTGLCLMRWAREKDKNGGELGDLAVDWYPFVCESK